VDPRRWRCCCVCMATVRHGGACGLRRRVTIFRTATAAPLVGGVSGHRCADAIACDHLLVSTAAAAARAAQKPCAGAAVVAAKAAAAKVTVEGHIGSDGKGVCREETRRTVVRLAADVNVSCRGVR
jgi:hypothetical protein